MKILAISYMLPPMLYPQAIQIGRLLYHLGETIVAVSGVENGEPCDAKLYPNFDNKMYARIKVPFVNKVRTTQFGKFFSKLYTVFSIYPDKYRNWIDTAEDEILKWAENTDFEPDIILTFGQPMSDHLLGLRLNKYFNKPWIAHFSDPWVDNIYRLSLPFSKFVNRSMESQVIENAQAVIFTSEETLELVMSKYPVGWGGKAYYLPHSIQPDLYDALVKPSENEYILRYIGNLYGKRSPRPLFEALSQTIAMNRELLYNVKIEFIGNMPGRFRRLLKKYPEIIDTINLQQPVGYKESLDLMQSAHCLLVIDAPDDKSVFFPSKLVDYIGAGKYIFAITPEGTAKRIVLSLGCVTASPENIEEIKNVLIKILRARPNKLPIKTNEYDIRLATEKLKQVINNII